MLRRITILFIGLALVSGLASAFAAEPETEAANAAVEYIKSLQNADGGFPAFGEESAPGSTIDAVFALVAAGDDPLEVTSDGNSPFDYLEAQAADYATDPGAAAKLALGAILGLGDLFAIPVFGEINLLDFYDSKTGRYGLDLFDHAFWLLGFAAFLESGVPSGSLSGSVDYLRSIQLDDGGWEFDEGFASDSNTTAMVVQALIASGVASDHPAIADALDYFRSIQGASGAFAFLLGSDPDAQSTAMVIQALVAVGEDLDAWAVDGVTPIEALLAFQNPETGAFQFAGEDSPFATYQVVPALMLAPFPGLETQVFLPPTTAPPPVDYLGAPTPSPTVPLILPPSGAGPDDRAWRWGLPVALVAVGVGAAAVGALVRRLR